VRGNDTGRRVRCQAGFEPFPRRSVEIDWSARPRPASRLSPDFSSNLPAGRGQAADNKWDRRPTVAGGRQTVCKNATKGRIPRSGGILCLLRQAR
jgi:hypothetical protein